MTLRNMNQRCDYTARKSCGGLNPSSTSKQPYAVVKSARLPAAVDFNPASASGTIIANITCCARNDAHEALDIVTSVLASPYAFSNRFAILQSGSRIGSFTVPSGAMAICTVCSMTLSGLFHNRGIVVEPKFGGVVVVENGLPKKFSAFLSSGEALLAPLEDFLHGAMTSVRQTLQTGNGEVLAGFLEIPESYVLPAKKIYAELTHAGMGTKIMFGTPNQPLLGMPVSVGSAGMVVFRDINTVAALYENGIRPITQTKKVKYRFEEMLPAHTPQASKLFLQ